MIERGQPTVVDPAEIAEVGWFNAEQLPQLLHDSARHAISDACAGACGVLSDILVYD